MLLNSPHDGSLRTVHCLCILMVFLFGHAQAQSPTPAKGDFNPMTRPYNERTLARVFGNIGGWWSFMKDDDKTAFLDGYQAAMSQSLSRIESLCKAIKDTPASNQEEFHRQAFTALVVCNKTSEFEGF